MNVDRKKNKKQTPELFVHVSLSQEGVSFLCNHIKLRGVVKISVEAKSTQLGWSAVPGSQHSFTMDHLKGRCFTYPKIGREKKSVLINVSLYTEIPV